MLPVPSFTFSAQACPHLDMASDDAQVHRLVASASDSTGGRGCALLFSPPLPATTDDSPPDSPSMPWRPGSSAYPPPVPIRSISSDDSSPLHRQQSKRDLQKIYEALSEASYDLSLRDIVQPPFSIDGSTPRSKEPVRAESEAMPDEFLPLNPACVTCKVSPCHPEHQPQLRSQSCRKFESSKYTIPSTSSKGKLKFSFSCPRRATTHGHSSSPSQQPIWQQSKSSPAQENSARSSSLLRLEHVLATPPELPASPFQREHNNVQAERRGELNLRGTFSVPRSSSRVHPSNQCSSCSSSTIFFNSRCIVCEKLYCSNCAKDELDSMSDGLRCKRTCNSRLGSKRFSRSTRSGCWSLCCNVDVSMNNPSMRKASY